MLALSLLAVLSATSPPDPTFERWLTVQEWLHDVDAPIVSLGEPGTWDDTHLFAPTIMHEAGRYSLYYCGSTSDVANRVFQLGLYTSADGHNFDRHPKNPIYHFGDGKHSVLTPALLRNADGSVRREDGRLRMWFASTDFTDPSGLHTLHETRSADGIAWDPPSDALLSNVYAPTILYDGGMYRMWYVDVSAEPWIIRHAQSIDGRNWNITDAPCVTIDQPWEKNRLFYPYVVKADGAYLMWYGAYWTARANTTALGLAVSKDGISWTKNPHNPVFTPDPERPWESHYTTSHSLIRDDAGLWRIWYATRKAPPHVNKYFAIGTASWQGPPPVKTANMNDTAWKQRSTELREHMAEVLTLQTERVPLDAQTHRRKVGDGFTVESITYASEPGSRVTALLYLPEPFANKIPAVILACGHGGSKSALYAQYAGQLYAKLGFACLAVDTIGEEERHVDRGMGTRAHDLNQLSEEERHEFVTKKLPRSILGKIVWDLSRGIDYLQSRPEIDPERIGIMGYSLGGTSAGALAVLDQRIRAAVICGWAFTDLGVSRGKVCTRLPYEQFAARMSFDEMTALLAPHCATLFLSGDHDAVIDLEENGAGLVRKTYAAIDGARNILDSAGINHDIACQFIPDADHRPLFITADGVRWMRDHLVDPSERRPIPDKTIHYGAWVESQGQQIEKLYNTEARERGTAAIDLDITYYPPDELACFPDTLRPTPEYTFQGWLDSLTNLR